MAVSTPAPLSFTRVYMKEQTAMGAAVALTAADRILVQSITITEGGDRSLERNDLMFGHGGAALPVQLGRYWDINIVAEIYAPTTPGSQATLPNLALWKACPVIITDKTTPPRIDITQGVGSDANYNSSTTGDYSASTLEMHVDNGLRRQAIDVILVPTKIDCTGGTVCTVTFVGSGRWTPDAASTLSEAEHANPIPIVAIGSCVNDDIITPPNNNAFGCVVDIGNSVATPHDYCATYGYGRPYWIPGGTKITYNTLSTTDYQSDILAPTDISIAVVFGPLSLDFDTARLLNVDDVDIDGVQGLTISAVSSNHAGNAWRLILSEV